MDARGADSGVAGYAGGGDGGCRHRICHGAVPDADSAGAIVVLGPVACGVGGGDGSLRTGVLLVGVSAGYVAGPVYRGEPPASARFLLPSAAYRVALVCGGGGRRGSVARHRPGDVAARPICCVCAHGGVSRPAAGAPGGGESVGRCRGGRYSACGRAVRVAGGSYDMYLGMPCRYAAGGSVDVLSIPYGY